jgi:hypothetical protein
MSFSLATIDIDGMATPVVQAGGALYRLQDVAPLVLSAPGALMSVLERWPDNKPVLVDAVGRLGHRACRASCVFNLSYPWGSIAAVSPHTRM